MRTKLTKITLAATLGIALALTFSACSSDGDDGNNDSHVFKYDIGDTGPGGGIIFYRSAEGFTMSDDGSIAYYLEAAQQDIALSYAWSTRLRTQNNIKIDGTEKAIGTGRKNTALILSKESNAPAARAVEDLSIGGKTDWFLPSLDELHLLYQNKNLVSGLATALYWSSTEQSIAVAYALNFGVENVNPSNSVDYKDSKNSVRAIRAFADESPNLSSNSLGGGGSSNSYGGGSSSSYGDGQQNIIYGDDVMYDGRTYKTVVIGTQTWMAENLNYVPTGRNFATDSWCYEGTDEYDGTNLAGDDGCEKYGRLYNWATAMKLPSKCNYLSRTSDPACAIATKHKGICPDGYHIPTYAEGNILMNGRRNLKSQSGWEDCGPVSSGKEYVCEDTFGFSALPGGYRTNNTNSNFGAAGRTSYLLSASEDNNNSCCRVNGWGIYYNDNDDFGGVSLDKYSGYSIRCVKDN